MLHLRQFSEGQSDSILADADASHSILLNLAPAIGVLLIRFAISRMDLPTRQSYTMAVVHPYERSAASGITIVGRPIGVAFPQAWRAIYLRTQDL
jgi:hypothetical protein